MRLRIPGWSRGRPVPSDLYRYDDAASGAWSVSVAGRSVASVLDHGYVVITREWKAGDAVDLSLPMTVHRVRGNDQVAATQGRCAFERGPIVYCVEDLDRALGLDDLVVPTTAVVGEEMRPKLLGGVRVLTLNGTKSGDKAFGAVTVIPYFARDNRGLAPMAVWLRTP